MDLQIYYKKIRDLATTLTEEFPIIVSRDTTDGGKGGVTSEVAPRLAAKLVVDGTARLATSEEALAFRQMIAEAKRIADSEAAASRVRLTVLTSEEVKRLRSSPKTKE